MDSHSKETPETIKVQPISLHIAEKFVLLQAITKVRPTSGASTIH